MSYPGMQPGAPAGPADQGGGDDEQGEFMNQCLQQLQQQGNMDEAQATRVCKAAYAKYQSDQQGGGGGAAAPMGPGGM